MTVCLLDSKIDDLLMILHVIRSPASKVESSTIAIAWATHSQFRHSLRGSATWKRGKRHLGLRLVVLARVCIQHRLYPATTTRMCLSYFLPPCFFLSALPVLLMSFSRGGSFTNGRNSIPIMKGLRTSGTITPLSVW